MKLKFWGIFGVLAVLLLVLFAHFFVFERGFDSLEDTSTKPVPYVQEIYINEARHFDSSGEFIKDVFLQVQEKDSVYSEKVYLGEYLEVKFEKELDSENDIRLHLRNEENGSNFVRVYDSKRNFIDDFPIISEEKEYVLFLDNLNSVEDTFILEVLNLDNNSFAYLEFDYILDPVIGGLTSGGLRPQSAVCYTNGGTTGCDGTYPASCPTDAISCNDGTTETESTRKSGFAGVDATYFDTSVTDCVEISQVQACYEWNSDNNNPTSCSIDFDESGDGWSNFVTGCPGTAGTSGCVDITSNDVWDCSNFFGPSGNRAMLRTRATSDANPTTNVHVDQLWYNITYLSAGSLSVTLNEPTPLITTDETIHNIFLVNATVQCTGSTGDACGDVSGTLRYSNFPLEPATQISTSSSAIPFYADSGVQTCTKLNVSAGEDTCVLTWQVNATEIGSYNLDVLFSSEYSAVTSLDTNNAQVDVFGPPYIAVDLVYPLSDPAISVEENFEVSCQVDCFSQDCTGVQINLEYCSGSLFCAPDITMDTTSAGLFSNVSSVSIGTITSGDSSFANFLVTGDISNDYVFRCFADSANTDSNFSITETSLHVNAYPVADFIYPINLDWLHGTEILNGGSSYDSDGTILNYKFEIDDNSGFTSPTTICDSISSTCSLNTITQTERSQEGTSCYLNLTVEDDFGVINSTIIQVGIDNVGPTVNLGNPLTNSYINVENYLMNASAVDSGSNVSCVSFESNYSGSWESIGLDCSNPYEFNWDLSSISDMSGIGVRAVSNDTEGNFGSYDLHTGIIYDTTSPVIVSDTPLNSELIFSQNYLLNASSSYDSTSQIENVSWYYFDSGWNLIGSDVEPSDGFTYPWNILISDSVYDLRIEAYDFAGNLNFTNISSVTIDVVNDNPTCIVTSPLGGENVSQGIYVSSSVFDGDVYDVVENVTFYYSSNNGLSWNLIGTNSTSGLGDYSYFWDTTIDIDSDEYLINCSVYDTRLGTNTNTSSAFIVDNTPPIISLGEINDTSVTINSPICFNVSVTDNLVGVNEVIGEIYIPLGSYENLTLYDDGSSCDAVLGDGIYSGIFNTIYDGNYNWSGIYASDNLGNMNYFSQEVLFNATSNAFLISELLSPLSSFEINESIPGNSFDFTCNITCDIEGVNCENVEITPEYDISGFVDITTLTSELVSEEDFYSCGTLVSGESCIHTFTINSTSNSGNQDFNLRCHGASTNAAADFSSTVLVHINDEPFSEFTYPTNLEWLHGIEILNASNSFDSDGSLINYRFEIDDNSGFSSPTTICDSTSYTCSLNTITQTECFQEGSQCYLRLIVQDDSGVINSTIIQVGIDNVGPTTILGNPLDSSYVNMESYLVNASSIDSGSGISCIDFVAYSGGSWNPIGLDCSSPYEVNWDLSSIDDEEGIIVRARANDSEGNFGGYSTHNNIIHDATAPSINLISPEDNYLTGISTVSFDFNFMDSISSTANCTLNLNGLVNQSSIVSNYTWKSFTVELGEGIYSWNVSCEDEAGNINFSEMRNLEVDLSAPSVLLDDPNNNYWSSSNSLTFNFTPIDNNLDTCVFYGNFSGSWDINQTNSSVLNWETNSFDLILEDNLYIWNVWCNDTVGNSAFGVINHTLGVDTIYPLIDYGENTTLNNSYQNFDWIFVNVTINETNVGEVVLNWNGINETIDNNYYENKTGLPSGEYNFSVYVRDLSNNTNVTELRKVTLDYISPNWSNLNQTVGGEYSSIVHHGEEIILSADFSDYVGLSKTWLSTNESGSWKNYTKYNLSGTTNTSLISWMNNSVVSGQEVYFRIYSEDLAGNFNVTDVSSFTVWGYSEISSGYLSPSGIKEGSTSMMFCQVQDNTTSKNLVGYNVSFYREGVYVGNNVTGSDGFTTYSFTEASAGSYEMTCNITGDATIYYNVSQDNFFTQNLGVGYGLFVYDYTDTADNKAYEGITDLTTTEIDDPYTDLENDNAVYQDYQSGQGNFAYTRFEILVHESPNEITELNFTWNGRGEVGSGTQGYILYVRNFTSGTWVQGASVTTATDTTSYISHTAGISDFIDGTGHVWLLARTQSAAPSTGSGGSRWARISTDYVKLDVYTDIIPPTVTLTSPNDFSNFSSNLVQFDCFVDDDNTVSNVSLLGDWNFGWHINSTNSSGVDNVSYLNSVSLEEGNFNWNCYACDVAGNCDYSPLNRSFIVDQTAPTVTLAYPNLENFSSYGIPYFNFSVVDSNSVENCDLYGNWTTWTPINSISNPGNDSISSFPGENVLGDGFYSWNVNCSDYSGNSAYATFNNSFAAFLFPDSPELINITQTANDGTGTMTLRWNDTNHSIKYLIYSGNDLSSLSYLGETTDLNFTDSGFEGTSRKYYSVHSYNPIGENASQNYFGAHLYTLRHDSTSGRNWVGFPTNFSYLQNASSVLADISGIESFNSYNSTTQNRVTCNGFSCPEEFACTDTACDFKIDSGRGYEIEMNIGSPSEVNWSGVGIVRPSVNVDLVKKAGDFGKNWVSIPASSSLVLASDLSSSISNSETVSRWDSIYQTSEGLLGNVCFPWGLCVPLGEDFSLSPEEGYEISVSSSGGWMQE